MYYTLQTDCIESKDVAGMLAKDDLREQYYEIIDLTIRVYRDGIRVNWINYKYQNCLDTLVELIKNNVYSREGLRYGRI